MPPRKRRTLTLVAPAPRRDGEAELVLRRRHWRLLWLTAAVAWMLLLALLAVSVYVVVR
jgi:hypothetical protein